MSAQFLYCTAHLVPPHTSPMSLSCCPLPPVRCTIKGHLGCAADKGQGAATRKPTEAVHGSTRMCCASQSTPSAQNTHMLSETSPMSLNCCTLPPVRCTIKGHLGCAADNGQGAATRKPTEAVHGSTRMCCAGQSTPSAQNTHMLSETSPTSLNCCPLPPVRCTTKGHLGCAADRRQGAAVEQRWSSM
jgi:hypothetical protein